MDYSIPGQLIHQTQDAFGPIYVYEDGNRRILSFDAHIEQSSVWINQPGTLLYPYAQTMMLSLLLCPRAPRITLLGLGGGSIANALLRHIPQCEVRAVELRAALIDIAHSYFHLPRSARLDIHIEDAYQHLRHTQDYSDIIFADLFLSQSMNAVQTHETFLHQCYRRLNPGGVLAINIWNQNPKDSKANLHTVRQVFEHTLSQMSVAAGNSIILAFKGPPEPINQREFLSAAQALGQRMAIPLRHYAVIFWQNNLSILQT